MQTTLDYSRQNGTYPPGCLLTGAPVRTGPRVRLETQSSTVKSSGDKTRNPAFVPQKQPLRGKVMEFPGSLVHTSEKKTPKMTTSTDVA